MLNRLFQRKESKNSCLKQRLYNEQTFYREFVKDVNSSKYELIIESPFMTMKRTLELIPYLKQAKLRGVNIVINTRNPSEHDGYMRNESEQCLELLSSLEVTILFTGKLHRKLAIIDREISWSGSLNILSQNDSCEIVQRTDSKKYSYELIKFIGVDKYL